MATEPSTPGHADSLDEAPLTPPVPVASGAVASLPIGDTVRSPPATSSPVGPLLPGVLDARALPLLAGVAAPTLPLAGSPLGRPKCPTCGERFSRGSRFCAFDGARLADAAEDAPTDPMIGRTLGGKYTVVARIGEGGMGTVYEVRHASLDRRFALKLLRPEIAQNAEHVSRFLQEAKAAAAIGHPNIVTVSDFGEHAVGSRNIPFFVMELLRGASLAAVLKTEKTLSPRRAAKIVGACAEALAAAHACGVIHRDLKPDNIFLAGESNETPKVLDFGVAKMSGAARLTQIGMVFGTPHYMSPEQARGQAIDHRSDIYSLGVILYECLAGRVPFEADTSMGVLTKQIFANPEPIERVAPDARRLGALGSIVMRCLAKEPDDRYATMDDLAAAIRQVVLDPSAAAAGALGGASGPPRRAGLRLREDAALPRASADEAEPEPRAWTRLVLVAGAVVAVLALVFVSVRTFLLPDSAAAGSDAAASAQTLAPAASSSLATQPPAPPLATSGAAAPTAALDPSVPTVSPSSSSRATPSSSATSSGAATRPSGAGVIDPWSNRPAPTPRPGGIVDPWAARPKK